MNNGFQNNQSSNQSAPVFNKWQKLLRKRTAMAGISVIILASIFALFAYFIAGDYSPNANEQHPEIALKGPMFKTPLLKVKKNFAVKDVSWMTRLLFGQDKPYESIPFKEIHESADEIVITNHYNQQKFIQKERLYESSVKYSSGERLYLLGTDKYGRSIFSRLVLGIRISLFVGLLAVFISVTLGILIGALGGYYGKWIDAVVMFFINTTWSIPTLLLVFAIVLALGRGVGIIFLAVGLTMWVDVARIVRGQVIKVKETQYVTAARSMGFIDSRIIIKHILPNIVGPVLVIAAANFATAILIEAGLSYLGFGIRPPAPSIGNMLNEHYGYAISGHLFLAFVPAITIMVLVLAFNLIGSGLRDVFDVK